jgi:hypothetical protein
VRKCRAVRRAFFGSVVVITAATIAMGIAIEQRAFSGDDTGLQLWAALVLGWLVTLLLGVAWLIVHFAKRSRGGESNPAPPASHR